MVLSNKTAFNVTFAFKSVETALTIQIETCLYRRHIIFHYSVNFFMYAKSLAVTINTNDKTLNDNR